MAGVDGDAVGLHAQQDVDEWQLHVTQQRQRGLRLQLVVEDAPQLERRMGALHRDLGAAVVVERQLARVVVGGHQLAVEIPDGQVGEVVGTLVGLDQVGGEGRVGRDTGQRPSLGGERVSLALGVVQHLGTVGVGQPGGHGLVVVGVELIDGDPRRRTGRGGQGEVLGPGIDRPGDADDLQAHRNVDSVLGQPRGHTTRRDVRDSQVGRSVGRGRLVAAAEVVEQPLSKGRELQGVEDLVDGVAVPLGREGQVGGDGGQVEVADERVDAPVAEHVVEVLAQRVAGLARDLLDVGHQRVERAVGGDPLGGGLGPDAGNAGQVVAGLAHQCGEVGIVVGGDAVLVLDRGGRHAREVGDALAWVEHGGRVADQLEGVAVAGADEHVHAGGLGLGGEGADDVVGLEAVLLERGDAQRLEDVLDERDLTGELGRGLAAIALVVGVRLGAERLAGDVERHADMRGLLVAQDVDEHRREPEHGVGVLSRGGREVLDGEGEEGSVGDGMAVDQQQAIHLTDSSHVLRHRSQATRVPLTAHAPAVNPIGPSSGARRS